MADANASDAVSIDPLLLEVIVCPADHGALTLTGELLVCATCGLGYPVRDGIPVLLSDDAVPGDGA